MAYQLTVQIRSADLPEGDWHVTVVKNKADKKDRSESKTEVAKRVSNPTWKHSAEIAAATVVVALLESGADNSVKLLLKDPKLSGTTAVAPKLIVWTKLIKSGSSSSSSSSVSKTEASGSIVPSTTSASSSASNTKKVSLRTARTGTMGQTARPIAIEETGNSESLTLTKPAKKHNSQTEKRNEEEESEEESEEKFAPPKRKKKASKPPAEEEPEDFWNGNSKAKNTQKKPKKVASTQDSDDTKDNLDDEEEYDVPPKRKKQTSIPTGEDPEDFWNGTSNSKTTQKKKEIKKLKMSLESMTINLKSSWNSNSAANKQQRFSVLINEATAINMQPDSCASYSIVGESLVVKIAYSPNLTFSKASGCGVHMDKWMFVEMVFPDGKFLSEEPKSPKTLTIRQCVPVDSADELNNITTTSVFGLWWTLENRLTEHIKDKWSTYVNAVDKLAKDPVISGNISKNSSVTSDAWAMLEILEWPPSQLPVVIKALNESRYDVKEALDLVLESSWLSAAKSELNLALQGKDKKSSSSVFLQPIIDELRVMVEDAGKYCPICCEAHPLELFKPIVCGKELCKFQFNDLGLGVDFESELIHSPNSVDLLILTTSVAVHGAHFDPFPKDVSVKIDGITHTIEDASTIAACLSVCPSVDTMIEYAKRGTLRAYLQSLHPLLYVLLRWIITSSRAHLHFLTDKDDLIPQIDTPFQFHMKSSPPEKEQKFYAAKKKYGTFFAWHGSPSANWHSILRNGLKNYSKTQHQAHGAAYGAGVYMAVDAGTSIGYSRRATSPLWKHSMYMGSHDEDLIILALCEVINEGELLCTGNVHRPHCLHSHSAPYYRIEKDEWITTRYLFVIQNTSQSALASDIASWLKTKQLLRSNRARK